MSLSANLSDITLAQLQILASLPRFDSIRAMARDFRLSPAQLSKTLASLEDRLGLELLVRSSTGVNLTEDGRALCSRVEEIVNQLASLDDRKHVSTNGEVKPIRIASRGFLNSFFAPKLTSALHSLNAHGFFVDMSPNETMEASRSGAIDLAVTLRDLDLGKTWTSRHVGEVVWELYTHESNLVSPSQLLNSDFVFSIVGQAFWDGKVVVLPDPATHLPKSRFQITHRAQTAFVALSMLRQSPQSFAFLPNIIERAEWKMADIKKIEIPGVKKLTEPLFLAANLDRVQKKVFDVVAEKCIESLRL